MTPAQRSIMTAWDELQRADFHILAILGELGKREDPEATPEPLDHDTHKAGQHLAAAMVAINKTKTLAAHEQDRPHHPQRPETPPGEAS